jgi:hypothetical protein
MHLNTFFWEGVRMFRQTVKGAHGKKYIKNPALLAGQYDIQYNVF